MWCNGCAARWCTAQKKCTGWCGRYSGGASETFEEALNLSSGLRPYRSRPIPNGRGYIRSFLDQPEVRSLQEFTRELNEEIRRVRVTATIQTETDRTRRDPF